MFTFTANGLGMIHRIQRHRTLTPYYWVAHKSESPYQERRKKYVLTLTDHATKQRIYTSIFWRRQKSNRNWSDDSDAPKRIEILCFKENRLWKDIDTYIDLTSTNWGKITLRINWEMRWMKYLG